MAAVIPRAATASGLMFSSGAPSLPPIEIPVRSVNSGVSLGHAVERDVDRLVLQVDRATAAQVGDGGVDHERIGPDDAVANLEVGQSAAQLDRLRGGADDRAEQPEQIEAQSRDDGPVDLAALHQQLRLAVRACQHVLDAESLAAEADAAARPAGEGAQRADLDIKPVQQACHRQALHVELDLAADGRVPTVRLDPPRDMPLADPQIEPVEAQQPVVDGEPRR